jgi:hypothetical protein
MQGMGYEVHTLNVNPLVKNDGSLQAGSPAIGAGPNVGYGANIGAYQYLTGATAPLVSLTASPTNIITGLINPQHSTLTWSSVNAASVMLSGFGPVPLNGSTNVSPAKTTVYTATAISPNRTNSASVTVMATPASPILIPISH